MEVFKPVQSQLVYLLWSCTLLKSQYTGVSMSTRSFYTSLFKLCLYLAAAGIVIAQYTPDHQARILEELDHIFVDIGGRNDAQFASAITPCSRYLDVFRGVNNDTFGRQSSAQWIRAAFRMVSAFLCIFCIHFHVTYTWGTFYM